MESLQNKCTEEEKILGLTSDEVREQTALGNVNISKEKAGKSYLEIISDNLLTFFNLVWDMGIQIIIFIIGLKSIPPYLYEVANMEGATKWETFWKITFPLLTPSILLCFVYTIVDHFNSYRNAIIVMIRNTLGGGNFHYSSTQSWIYALIVFAFAILAYAVLAKRIVRLD